MNYNDLVPEMEQTTVCPYNKAHIVLNFRFNNHLVKCRKSYSGDDLKTCPFNSSHIIPKPEFYFHKKTCADRKIVLNYLQSDKTQEQKEKKKFKSWDDDEELETKDAKIKILKQLPSISIRADLYDNEVNNDDFGKNLNENQGGRHGYDDDDENVEKTNDKPYNPLAHLQNSIRSSSNQNLDQSDRYSVHSNHSDDRHLVSSHQDEENIPNNSQKPKEALRGWSDDEDDVPSNSGNSDVNNYKNSQNDNRSYRESSTDSFRSNRSNFQQNKNLSRFSRNHSNSPHSSRSQNSPYNRPESRQFRGISKESDSNVSTSSRNSQNYRNKRFDRQDRRSHESSGSRGSSKSHETSKSHGSSKSQDLSEHRHFSRDNRSQESSRSRESSIGYNKNSFGQDRRNSNNLNASGYNNKSGGRGSHQKYSNGRFNNQNSGSSSKYEEEFAKILENIDKSPEATPENQSQHQDIPANQNKRKLTDWSDDEDDVPTSSKSDENCNRSSPNFDSSPQNSNVSSTLDADPSSNPPEAKKNKLKEWSDDEDDVTPSSIPQSNNFSDSHSNNSNWSSKSTKYSSRRLDDNSNEIENCDKIPITKSKTSKTRFFSHRPSDEEILKRFERSSQFKNYMQVDSWYDKRFRGKMDGNIGIFN